MFFWKRVRYNIFSVSDRTDSSMAQTLRICPQCRRPGFSPWIGKMPWRREWLLTPAFLSGEFHGQRSLAGYNPRGCKESDMTMQLTHSCLSLSLRLRKTKFEDMLPVSWKTLQLARRPLPSEWDQRKSRKRVSPSWEGGK